jgi:hypothetical protein
MDLPWSWLKQVVYEKLFVWQLKKVEEELGFREVHQ